jgi:hypothetical protein
VWPYVPDERHLPADQVRRFGLCRRGSAGLDHVGGHDLAACDGVGALVGLHGHPVDLPKSRAAFRSSSAGRVAPTPQQGLMWRNRDQDACCWRPTQVPVSCVSRPGDGEKPAKSDGSTSQPSRSAPLILSERKGGDRVAYPAEYMADRAQTHMGGSRRRTTPRHGPQLGSDEALGVCDDPPGNRAMLETCGLAGRGCTFPVSESSLKQ